MGGGHAKPTVTQNCGPTIIISGNHDTFNAPGANLSGSDCHQGVTAKAGGAKVTTKVAPNIVVPGLLQNLINQGVKVADATNTNPGVVIANASDLYVNQPGV